MFQEKRICPIKSLACSGQQKGGQCDCSKVTGEDGQKPQLGNLDFILSVMVYHWRYLSKKLMYGFYF